MKKLLKKCQTFNLNQMMPIMPKSLIVNHKKQLQHKSYHLQMPGDKSISQRATFLASLAEGVSHIKGILWSEDTINNLLTLQKFGIKVESDKYGKIAIHGVGLRGLKTNNQVFNLGNSATSSRIMLALCSGQKGSSIINGNEILRNRSMEWIKEPLDLMGANIQYLQEQGKLPILVNGTNLKGIEYFPKVASAQAVSSVLFASLLADGSTIIHKKIFGRDHTERLFKYFGIHLDINGRSMEIFPPESLKPHNIEIPGDFSSAAFIIAFVVMFPFPGLKVTISNVGLNKNRIGFIKVLKRMGANIIFNYVASYYGEPRGSIVIVSGNSLHGINILDESEIQSMVDEIPLLAIVAATANRKTIIDNAQDLRDKDSDRIQTTLSLLHAFGIHAEATLNGLIIYPTKYFKSPRYLAVPKDHRIAMTAVILASLLPQPTHLYGLETIAVSFPSFFDIFKNFAHIKIYKDSTLDNSFIFSSLKKEDFL